MKSLPKEAIPILLVLLLLVAAIGGCTGETVDPGEPTEADGATELADAAEATPEPTVELYRPIEDYPVAAEDLGSGDVKWEETDTPDGWTEVTNEGGTTLGYTKGTKVQIIQVDGYAYKDLNHNGSLDVFEDWQIDYEVRAESLVEQEDLSTEWMMGLKMNPFGVGSASADELEEQTVQCLDWGFRQLRFPGGSTPVETIVGWNNLIQEYVENLDMVCIPTTFVADPLGGDGVSNWPGYLGVAASFDPELAAEYGRLLSEEWRALGVSMKVAPQIDLATDPRWQRCDLTFGEDPALSCDMAVAMVNAWQSTYDEGGNDLGWGEDSVNCQIKHLMGEGAAEGGRESHSLDGAYNVFPGGQFYTHLMPFAACLDLPGKTEAASCAMTNFSIAVDGNGDSIGGERVATSFSEWKINDLWRGVYDWDGYILTDFMVVGSHKYGVEDLTDAERMLLILTAGCDAFGGEGGEQEDIDLAMEAYALGVEELGQEAMDEIMTESTRRTLKTLFNVGVVDNPYISVEKASTVANSEENQAAAFDAQVKSIVMLKNSGNVISEASASAEKQTVYIPWTFVPEQIGWGGTTPASVAPCMDLDVAREYYDVVTDAAGDPSGPEDEEGNPTFTADDIVRASAEDVATCDFAIVRIASPQNANPTTLYGEDSYDVPEDYVYRPISLQYRSYTADSQYVRLESIGGQVIEKEVEGTYDTETVYEKSNTSYYGQTAMISNESDLDLVLYTASIVDKVVVAADVQNTMIFSEFESEVDAIIVAWGGDRADVIDTAAYLEVISGNVEPSGLLPMQMPANMETVEAQYEDVPRDMECYVDSEGNTYDFTFGMNWAGVINDERTEKYNVPPLVGEDPFN